IRIIEETRSAIAEERYQAGYTEDRYQVYVALVELLLKLHKPGEAFLYSEKLRARAYLDRFGRRAPSVPDPAVQQRILELAEQIRSLRRAIQNEYSAPQNDRRGQALEAYSAELAEAERNYEALLSSTGSSVGDLATGQERRLPSVSEVQHLLPTSAA